MKQATETNEIPDETYDSLVEIFNECIENDLGLVLHEGLYAELAEWYGCEGAEKAITEWMDERMIEEMEENWEIEADQDSLVLYTENFRASFTIQTYDGAYLSSGYAHHLEMDEYEWDVDDIPWVNGAGDEAAEILREIDNSGERSYDTRWY